MQRIEKCEIHKSLEKMYNQTEEHQEAKNHIQWRGLIHQKLIKILI